VSNPLWLLFDNALRWAPDEVCGRATHGSVTNRPQRRVDACLYGLSL